LCLATHLFCLILFLNTNSIAQSGTILANQSNLSDNHTKTVLLRTEAEATLNSVYTRVPAGWRVIDDGLSKIFFQDITRPLAESDFGNGEILRFKLEGKYFSEKSINHEKILISANFKAIGNYPKNLLSIPVNDEHRLSKQKKHLTCDALLIKFRGNWLSASYFNGIGHPDWKSEGDFFNLFPEQFDVYTYKRVSGRRAPNGAEVVIYSPFGRFQVLYGEELVWGDGKTFIGKWNARLGKLNLAAFYKDEQIVWGEEGEHLREAEIFIQTKPDKLSRFSIAILYRPFRIDWPYTFVERVPKEEGFLNTIYRIEESQTKRKDAFGATLEYKRDNLPFSLNLITSFTYLGLLAGNKSEISLALGKIRSSHFNFYGEVRYRTPLKGPNPHIFEGTIDNPGPTRFSPRGPEAPFWVMTENRKTYLFSLTIKYGSAPIKYFYGYRYKYRSNVLMPPVPTIDNSSSFLLALRYTLADFPTTTDLLRYVDEFGNTVWEPFTTNGLWATSKPIHYIELLSRIPMPRVGIEYLILQLNVGQSLATGSFAYGSNTPREKPITGLNEFFFGGQWKYLIFGFEYGKWIWGPEDWQPRFGESIDERVGAYLEINPTSSFNIALGYVRYREVDDKFLAPELGPFDELILSLSYRFSIQKEVFF
jgi:hypothetical protein